MLRAKIQQQFDEGVLARNNAIMLARDIQHDLARPDLPADIADRIARVLAPVQTLVRSHPRWHDAACQANCLQQAISCRGEGESLCAEVADWAARWIALNPHLTSIGNFLFKQRRSEAGRELPLALRERVGVRADGERAGRRKDVLESATPQPNLLLEGEGDLARVKELNRKILWAEIALGICAPGALPPFLGVDPTNVCDFRCRHCYQGFQQDFRHTHIDPRSIDKVADCMPAVTELTLGGTGEPSLSPALPLLCELGKRYEVCSRVITNGAALVNPRAGLDNAGVVTVSFDGAAKRTFEAIRVGTSFETLLDRIARFRQRNPKTTIILNAAVCRANIDEIYGMAKWAVRLKANGLGLNKLFPYMDHLKPLELRRSDAPLLRRQLRKARKLCSRHGIDLMNSVHLGDAPADDGPIDKERLLAGLESVAVVRGMKTPDLEASCAAAEGHDWQYLPASVAEFDRPEEPVAGPATCRPAAGDRPGGAWDVDALECRLGELTERLKQTPPEDIRIPFCLSPWVKMRIVATSRITPCCVWPGHFEDLKEFETAREAWHSEAYVALRQQTLEPERMPEHCRTCSFVERYRTLPDLLCFLAQYVDLRGIRLPGNFFPPETAKVVLSAARANAAPEILDWRPRGTSVGEKFNPQASGSAVLLVQCKRIAPATTIVWEGRRLKTVVDLERGLVTAAIPAELYGTAGEYRIHLVDARTGQRSRDVVFSVRPPLSMVGAAWTGVWERPRLLLGRLARRALRSVRERVGGRRE